VPFIQEIFEPACTFFSLHWVFYGMPWGGEAFFGQGCWLVFKNMFREIAFFKDKTLFLLFAGYIVFKHLTITLE
jgi:hypothetical protein